MIPQKTSAGRHDERPEPRSSFGSESANLDIIRATAVLSVFFAHLYGILTGRDTVTAFHFAQMGVLIFFVHTSMVLMLSLERTKAEGKALLGSFYLRRFFRIYPLSIFCVTIAMAFSWAPGMIAPIRCWHWSEYLSNMALTTNLTRTDNMIGTLWTLPLEVQMYVALPFLFLLGRARSAGVIILLWVLSIPLAILQLNTSGRLSVLGYAPCFIAGVIAWKLSLRIKRRFPEWLWPFAFMATWPLFFLAADDDNLMYFRWLFCLGLGLTIPWFREVRFPALKVPAHYVAKYSYGIYLSHAALIKWTQTLPIPNAAQVAVLAVLAVIVPIALYFLIEHPMILVGRRLAKRIFQLPPRRSWGPLPSSSTTSRVP